jgi:glycogen debranching enzyme
VRAANGIVLAARCQAARHSVLFAFAACTVVGFVMCLSFSPLSEGQATPKSLELSRTVRPWEFLPVTGTRAGLFGNEAGKFEAWVYPLKPFREFHLTFHVGDRALAAESLARTLTVHPESASILYAGDSFRVRETLFVPVHEAGAVILLDVETEQSLEIEASFIGDFQLEWPASLGGTFISWDEKQRAFIFGEETKKFSAILGSPTAGNAKLAYQTNYSSSEENSFRLGVTQKGQERKLLILAASVAGESEAAKTYQRLTASFADLMRDSADYYRAYLGNTVSLDLPDAALQQAYDWARISTIQGLVTNPLLGTGLVAGYRTSGVSQRPGFAWFFGRDSFWTSFALNAEGDYATSRAALDFISKYQRDDGKIPHEISQSASLVNWFKDYPYAYVSADATPLFLIAVDDYVTQSGDVAFAQAKRDNIERAYKFLRSTYDSQGLAQNAGIGHGWVEGGPLLPVRSEYYQAGLGVEAVRAFSNIEFLLGDTSASQDAAAQFERQKKILDDTFWSPEKQTYAFALRQENQRAEEPSVLTTVPMWFGLPQPDRAEKMITQLAADEHDADWGMRIISLHSPVYDGSGYHFGAVWPLFTGWASVGEYRYHRAQPAYFNLRANALLATDGSLGHFTEVLSGDYNQSFSTSSPHQIWSSAMVISPILRGLLGLQTDAAAHQIALAPHIPADWTSLGIHNIHIGAVNANFEFRKAADSIVLEAQRKGAGDCWVEFSPALSLRAQIIRAELNGRPLPFKVQANANDQHVIVKFPIYGGPNTLVIHVKKDFGISASNALPPLGSASHELRILSETWNSARDQLTLDTSGIPGGQYQLAVWNAAQIISVEGAQLTKPGKLEIQFPLAAENAYMHQQVVIHLLKR